ncbi:hypothetical protein GCM10020256_29580 [Streptomyces thermocoprophilus]
MSETASRPTAPLRARAEIDLAALRANVRTLRARTPGAAFMAVVKADAYGHGALPCARAAIEAGAGWVGTATPEEALAVRADAGVPDDVRVMCWLWTPGGPWREAIDAGIDISVSGLWALRELTAAARGAARPARVQLKADTGLGRNGCQPGDWSDLVAEALRAQEEGLLTVTGVWSHFACADEPGHPSIAAQLAVFREMTAYAEQQGVRPEVRHIANSPAALTLPETHFDLVRPGIAMYGLSPSPDLGAPRRLRAAPGDDAVRVPRPGQACARRPRRLVRPPLRHRRRDHPRPRPRRLRRRRPAARLRHGARPRRRQVAYRRRADRHGPVRGGPRRRRTRAGHAGRAVRAG